MLLGAKDLQQLIDEQEVIEVNCELCGAQQRYDRVDIAALINQQTPSTPGSSPLH